MWFYRPLITLSFALDAALSGAHPFLAHFSNAAAHGIGAMLIGMIAARFTDSATGWWAALIWGLSPVHAGSVLWAVGRVDAHCVPWIAASVWFGLRWRDDLQRSRLPALLCFVLALGTKELAIATPGILAVLCWCLAAKGERTHRTAVACWPFFVVLGIYLAARLALFGHMGGYAEPPPLSMASVEGLGRWTEQQANPLLGLTEAGLRPFDAFEIPAEWLDYRWVGWAPVLLGAILLIRRWPLRLITLAVLYLGCAAPMAQSWVFDNPQLLRNFTLPFAAFAVLLASGHIWTAVPALALGALPLLEVRNDYLESHDRCRRIHELVADGARQLPHGPVFVANLPRINGKRNVIEFDVGVDRILQPPFGDGNHRVLALRPIVERADFPRLPYGDSTGLPLGHTLTLMDETGVLKLENAPAARFDARVDGEAHLTSAVLQAINTEQLDPALVFDGPRASHYRITLFTAAGYMTTIVANESEAGAGGRVPLRSWLTSEVAPGQYVARALFTPTALDLDTRFPLLVEAGRIEDTLAGPVFEAVAVARDWVWLQFDRDYAAFMGQK